MNEGDFHRLTPIEMELLRAKMRCVKCDALHGTCDCWTPCDCGWSYEKGTSCRNPECTEAAI